MKQRAKQTNMADAPKKPAPSVTMNSAPSKASVELAGFWGIPDPDGDGGDGMRGARIRVDLDVREVKAPVAAALIR
jgi:hypothetical protein